MPESNNCKYMCSINGFNVSSLDDLVNTGTISFGLSFVRVSNLVPKPATGMTAVSINAVMLKNHYKNE